VLPAEAAKERPGETQDLLTEVSVRICPNPVFVIGSPRSGTSVLPWSLAHHWDFWTSGETEFIHDLFDRAGAVYNELRTQPKTFLPSNDVDQKEFFASLGLGVNSLISSRSGRKRWIDQSPGYTTMVWTLAEMFPGASFIHVLRDGRAVVNSMIHFGDRVAAEAGVQQLQGWATDFEVAVETWRHYVEFALNFCSHNPDRTITVRNEDLIERTNEEFAKILQFLGARPNENPAEFFRTSRVNSSFGPLVWGTGKKALQRSEAMPRSRAAEAWDDWSPEQRATFNKIAGDLRSRLGYPD